jgi:serine/threonine protein kinase
MYDVAFFKNYSQYAIKVLPAHLSGDAELRFEREARTVAALNHPHICSVFDVGSQDSVDYIVMEFLDGQTLAARLARGVGTVKQGIYRVNAETGEVTLLALNPHPSGLGGVTDPD